MPKPLAEISAANPFTGPSPRVSIVILTLNEAINIRACLESCAWSDDVHVLDSGSTDGTRDLAARLGAGVHTNPFTSFGAQRNWAIDHIPLRHDWVFHLDADERFTPELVREMQALLATDPPHAGYYCANQTIFLGSWIKRASGYPAYQMRLFHKARMRFTDAGHGQRESTTGTLGTLAHPYVHYNFSKGLDDWLARHNRYSTQEAEQAMIHRAEPLGLDDLFKGGIVRRRAIKRLAARMPLRPTLRFWHTLIVQRAFLDGRAGLNYARLLRLYESMIDLKTRERSVR